MPSCPHVHKSALSLPDKARWSRARVAIVHDWFSGFHGSERVVDVIANDVFSETAEVDVFTFHADRDGLPDELSSKIVCESRLSRLPGIRQSQGRPGRWRYLLPYIPFYFRHLDLEAYDLVVSSSHACAVNARSAPGVPHLCYCHTPMRYAWLPEMDRDRAGGIQAIALRAMSKQLRRTDLKASGLPDVYIANSTAVRDRIRRFYGRDAAVVYPPVDVDDFDFHHPKEVGRFLWVHRFVPYKRPEVVVEAFRGLPHTLTMVGAGPLQARIRQIAPPNVEVRGWVAREELSELYGRASGFVHIGEEDFGISMVEALASGMPVIALNRGGARDIVRHGEDGILIDGASVQELRAALSETSRRSWDANALAERARGFSRAAFVTNFSRQVARLTA